MKPTNQYTTLVSISPYAADKPGDGPDSIVLIETKPKTKKPALYKVIMLNDDYTPMEFVVIVLEKFFQIGREAAVEIMMTVHLKGAAVVGVFTYEVAETKVAAVMEYARRHEHPLTCHMEKE
ncbi:UNVERIFIED_CONTAM: hypothetical protein GTU68_036755 [Idotea baltica]|nr:hypothetical protein [Idotea baltica]